MYFCIDGCCTGQNVKVSLKVLPVSLKIIIMLSRELHGRVTLVKPIGRKKKLSMAHIKLSGIRVKKVKKYFFIAL